MDWIMDLVNGCGELRVKGRVKGNGYREGGWGCWGVIVKRVGDKV